MLPRIPVIVVGLVGCGPAHRHVKFLLPEALALVEADPTLATVTVEGSREPVEPGQLTDREGRRFVRPQVLRDDETIVVSPQADDLEVRVFIRGSGWFDRHAFTEVHTVTGSLDRRVTNAVVPLDVGRPLSGDFRLSVAHLSSPFNAYNFSDGDHLLLSMQDGERAEHRMFVRRDVGLAVSGFAGLLVSAPIGDTGWAPVLAAGPTFGWRTPRPHGAGRVLDQVELVVSAGIGSTALDNAVDLDGVFDSALGGGGLRVFGVMSVQGFVNLSALGRDFDEAPGILAIGVDAAGLALMLDDAFSRLWKEHPVLE